MPYDDDMYFVVEFVILNYLIFQQTKLSDEHFMFGVLCAMVNVQCAQVAQQAGSRIGR